MTVMDDTSPHTDLPTDLPDNTDAAALKALVPSLVETCPDLYEMATAFAQKILDEHGLHTLKPEQVYWHRFHSSQSSDKTFTGWEHIEHPHDSMTLPQLVIQRFTVHDQDNMDLLDADCGFYTAGPEVGTYNETNEVHLFGSQVLKAFWAYNFVDHYKEKVEVFWTTQSDTFRTLAKCTFLAKALEDYEAGDLSADDLRTVIKASAGDVTWPATRSLLEAEHTPGADLRIRRLCVGSYVSTDILCIVDKNERQIVYVPGELWGFRAFNSVEDLHWWILSSIEQPADRQRFMSHFPAADHDVMEDTAQIGQKTEWALSMFPVPDLLAHFFREPHIENVGLSHVLDLLSTAWTNNDHQLLADQSEWIEGDPFTYLRNATHARMLADANFLTTTNGELRKKLWIGYLGAFSRVFGPMAAVGWPVALVVVGAGMASVGLNIDQAINGKTAAERKAGVTGAIFAAIDTLFNAMFLKTGGGLPEVAEGERVGGLKDPINEQPLEPKPAPHLEELFPERFPSVEPEDYLDSFKAEITEPTREGTGKAKGIIETLSGKKYVYLRWGTRRGHYQVRFVGQMNTWVIIDPTNPWSFSRNIPLRMNEYGHWEPASPLGLKGGVGGKLFGAWPWGSATDPLPLLDSPPTPYDVPEASRSALQPVAEGKGVLGDMDHGFKPLLRRLYDDAIAFFTDPPLPARPKIPALLPKAAAKDILKGLLNELNGLVLAEGPNSVACKQFLIDNMAILKKLKVKTLYLEQLLTDFHQTDLDTFTRTGKMPKNLERYLSDLDKLQGADPSGQYTWLELVRTAQKNHIRLQAIDCMASYRSSGMSNVDSAFQAKMRNYFSHTVIDADQALRGAHKWLALVNENRASLFDNVAGVSELEGAPSLRIEEAGVGKARGIEPDPGKIVGNDLSQPTVQSDLRLQLETPPDLIHTRELDQLLNRNGMFTLETDAGNAVLVSRNRDGALLRTPIQRDSRGYFVERPEWQSVHARRFHTLGELRDALIGRGMRLVRKSTDPLSETSATSEPGPSTHASPKPVPTGKTTVSVGSEYHIRTPFRAGMKDWVVEMERLRGTELSPEQLLVTRPNELRLASVRQKLLLDSLAFDSKLDWKTLPERPPIPAPGISFADFIEAFFKNASRLVIGESVDRIASARLLIENMAAFARQGVKTLYLPRLLNDFHQAELDLFFASKTAEMPSDLERYLNIISADQSPHFNDLEVVKSAREHGIRVLGTDCAASYTPRTAEFTPVQKQSTGNFLTTELIKTDQALHGSGKWIAVTPRENTNTFRNIPGLSERNGAVGLRVDEVGPGHEQTVTIDQGVEIDRHETSLDPIRLGRLDTLYADLYLPSETPLVIRTAAQRQRLLYKPGFYCVETSGDGLTLWHRSRTEGIVSTPIERLANGDYYVNRPSWQNINLQPFHRLVNLSRALSETGMQLQSRLPQ